LVRKFLAASRCCWWWAAVAISLVSKHGSLQVYARIVEKKAV